MQLVRPRDCAIAIGLQCNNKKCHKTISSEEWFYHCVANSSNATEHKGPYNFCMKCGHLKMKMIRKQLHYTYLKEGWMRKRPMNQVIGGKEFKRRYFKLGVDWKLWYFTKPQDAYSKDMIDLNFMTSIRKKHNYGIQIYESRGRKQWLFLCNSEQERNEWYTIMLLAYQSQSKKESEKDTDQGDVPSELTAKLNNSVSSPKQNKCLSMYGDDELL